MSSNWFRRTKRAILIAVWPLVGVGLITGLWLWTNSRISDEAQALEQKLRAEALALSKDYARWLEQSLQEINRLSRQIKHDWEADTGRLTLTELVDDAAVRNSQIANLLVLDAHGRVVRALRGTPQPASPTTSAFFVYHQNDDSPALLVGRAEPEAGSSVPMLVLSRRLSQPDGAFAGVVAVIVPADALTSYYAGAFPGESGLVAVAGLDGTLRSARIGEETRTSRSPVPLSDTPEGTASVASVEWLSYPRAQFLAWKTLDTYPLVAIVGLPERESFATHREAWAIYRLMAVSASVVLSGFLIAAALLSARLARRRQQEEAVRRTYRLATEGGDEGFYMWEAVRDRAKAIIDFTMVDCNERGAGFYGQSQKDLLGTRLSRFFPPAYFAEWFGVFCGAMDSGFFEKEMKVSNLSRLRFEWARVRLVRSGDGLAVTIQNTTERNRAQQQIEFFAHHDSLTGLPNRVLLVDRFEQARAKAVREGGKIALAFLDLDHFKHVNDSLGHRWGDELLKQVGQKIKGCIREADTLSRLGGDEFILLLTELHAAADVGRVVQDILEALQRPFDIEGQIVHTSASIGLVLFPDDGPDFESLLKNADTAMYQAKESGRNLYRFFTEAMNVDFLERLTLVNELRAALRNGEFRLHYQPQVDVLTGAVVGVEALIRWEHPDRGLVAPGRFIAAAEASGLIVPIGDWVLEEACRQAFLWFQSGHPVFRVAVNVSALQFRRGNILEKVKSVLERTGLPPAMIELELTESIFLQDTETTLRTISDLKALGVLLSIDDFGTGYSSLSYLRRLKVDKLKIDQSFVRDIVVEADDLAITQAIIQLGSTMKMQVIAEGVETRAQWEALREHGCHEAQGFYICRPLPAREMELWMVGR